MTSDGTGNFPSGLEDLNEGGTVSSGQIPFSGIGTSGGSVGGRVIVNLSGFIPATSVGYLSFQRRPVNVGNRSQ